MFLRSIRSTAFVFALAGSVIPLAACSGSATVGEPSTTASTSTSTGPLAVNAHGAIKHVADALAQVPLRADQRATIEQMAKDAEARMAPAAKAREDLVLAIADQVQAGAIDRTALQPKIDAVASAHLALQPANRAAFEKLHDLLTPEQRTAFVAALQAHPREHQGKGGEGFKGRLAKWATDLNLSQDQQDQIHEKIRARFQAHFAGAVTGADQTGAVQDGHMVWRGHEMHAQMEKTLEAFKGDKFSMDAVAPIPTDAKVTHDGANEFAGHMLNMVETALPILTPDQRNIAATKLRARAAKLDEEENAETAPAAQ